MAAPLMCAGISIYGGIQRANVPRGGSIGIIGIGGLGHIGTQVAKCMVCLMVSLSDSRLIKSRDIPLLLSMSNRPR